MNRETRRKTSKARRAALSFLVASALAAGGLPNSAEAMPVDPSIPDYGLLIIGGGGGGGQSGSSGGGGGGGAYVQYSYAGGADYYEFGGGGDGSVPEQGGSIGGGEGAFMGGAAGIVGPGKGTVDHGGGVDNASGVTGVAPKNSGSKPAWLTSVAVQEGYAGKSDIGGNGGDAAVAANDNAPFLPLLAVYGGNGGVGWAGEGGNAKFDASKLDAEKIFLGYGYISPTNPGKSELIAKTLIVKKGYEFCLRPNSSVEIGTYEFDISGVGSDGVLLTVIGGDLPLADIKITGTNGLAPGETITLIRIGALNFDGFTDYAILSEDGGVFLLNGDGTDLSAEYIGVSIDPSDGIFKPASEGYSALSVKKDFTVTNNSASTITGVFDASLESGLDFEAESVPIEDLTAGGEFKFSVKPVTGLKKGIYEDNLIISFGMLEDFVIPLSFTVKAGGDILPPPAPPGPPPPADKITLTPKDLDSMKQNAVNGVMTLFVSGDLDKLQIDVPLSWFMENLGMTLLVYNESLGLMAITSENMLELAALSYEGEGGVTVEVRGKELTFLPDTIISYLMEKGSIKLSVTSNGSSLDWYVYDSPLILGVPEQGAGNETDLIVYKQLPDGGEKIIPRSVARDGLVYALVNDEGRYAVKQNPVSFGDINGHWSQDAALFMAARGIMNGVGNGLFAPDSNVTRAQYVTMLMRMTDYNMTDYDPMPFPDLEPGSWYYESVCKAAASGAVRGNSDGLFEPHEAIDRQEIFAITYEVLTGFYLIFPGDGDEDALAGFSDASSVAPEYLKAVSEIVRNGLAQGSNGSLRPEAYLSRAEAAQFLANVVRCIVPDYTEFLKDNK